MAGKMSIRGQRVLDEKVELSRSFRKTPTKAEAVLWAAVKGKKIDGYKFRRQQLILGFIVDFINADTGLIVEVDGGIHEETIEYDRERDAVFESAGFAILRLKNDFVLEQVEEAIEQIRHELKKLTDQ